MAAGACWVHEKRASDYPDAVYVRIKGKRHRGKFALVSTCDAERVNEHAWGMWSVYPATDKGMKLHHFVIGPRPADVPEDWVVDHANGDEFDARRCNLRWTTSSFNKWNRLIANANSKYRGVVLMKNGKWRAVALGKHLGLFDTERAAAEAAAKFYIKEFGEWAMTSVVLTTNFTAEELEKLRKDADTVMVKTKQSGLPRGVFTSRNKFASAYKGLHLGTFATIEEAKLAYDNAVQAAYEKEWSAHLKTPILRDPNDSAAIIPLSGIHGAGLFSKVPDEYYHELTFNTSWSITGNYAQGVWKGKGRRLHDVIWEMMNPGWTPTKGLSIDHIKPEAKLDNRRENLRLATISDQHRNKVPVGNTPYPGVHRPKAGRLHVGQVLVKGQSYRVTGFTAKEAAIKLNALRVKLLGPNTPLIAIKD